MSSLAHQVIFQFRFLLPLRKNKEGDGALVYNSNKTKRYKDISLKKKCSPSQAFLKSKMCYTSLRISNT